jgi:hypothetical protein
MRLNGRSLRRTAQFGARVLKNGEIHMTWEFVTKPVRGHGYIVWEWEWRFTAEDGSTTASTRSFSSFRECVADARVH